MAAMSSFVPEVPGLPIAAVEQATGIARATLRIWERRYGFPQPGRDDRGERTYSAGQVERLRVIGALVARGHRPGRLIRLTAAQLAALAGPGGQPAAAGARVSADPVLALLREHDVAGLVRHLEEGLRTSGLAGFVTQRMPALNAEVGAGWARGELQVYEEHLYTEAVQTLLRNAIAALPAPKTGARPRALLATFPDEGHGLGLLMAQAMLALQGCPCTPLGLKVPVPQVVKAAVAFDADVVGLSFSASLNPAHVLRGLEQLRGELPPPVAVWAGGACPALGRRQVAGVQVFAHVREVEEAVAAWRARAATNPSASG